MRGVDKATRNERPTQLADVIVEIVAERGLEAVSVREVATRAGVSIGTVQHYFPTKDQMLAYAVNRVGEYVIDRMREITAGDSIGEGVRKMLVELLPLDEQRADEGKVWLSFLGRAIFTPDLLRRAQQTGREIEEHLAASIQRAQELGEAAQDIDPPRAARMLYAALEGLTVRALTDPDRFDTTETSAIFETFMARIFPATGGIAPQ